MAFHLYEDTWETTTTAGTGPFVLNGAVPRCRPFSAQYVDQDTCFYSAYDGVNFEHGYGAYAAATNTLVRATVYRSTNNNSQVNWSGNPVNVMVAPLGSVLEGILNPTNPPTPPATVASLNRLFLSRSDSSPDNEVLAFNSLAAVQAWYGTGAAEATLAADYFASYTGTQAQMLFTRFPSAGCRGRLYGANISGLSLSQLKSITNGSLSVPVGAGMLSTTSLNLSGVASFPAAAAAIETALNASPPTLGTFPNSTIVPVTATFTGEFTSAYLYASAVTGTIYAGMILTDVTGDIAAAVVGNFEGLVVNNQLLPLLAGESLGGVGRYGLNLPVGYIASEAVTGTCGLLTIGSGASGQISEGMIISGPVVSPLNAVQRAGPAANTWITGIGDNTGLATLTTQPCPIVVNWTQKSGASGNSINAASFWFVASAAYNPTSTGSSIGYASGSAAFTLGLTETSGAVLSPVGTDTPSQSTFMSNFTENLNGDFSSFQSTVDLDIFASSGLTTQAQAFTTWAASTGGQYQFLPAFTSTTPAVGNAPATPGIVGANVVSPIGQSHIPLVMVSSGTMGNNGALSSITAVANAYPNAYVYLPVGAIAAGSAAGWYFAQFSSTTAATVFNNTYSSGTPAIPMPPTSFVTTGPGAFTQTTGSLITGYSLSIPGNTIGPNGAIRASVLMNYNSSTNAKILKIVYSTFIFLSVSNSVSGDITYAATTGFSNNGATNVQSSNAVAGLGGLTTTAGSFGAIDSTATNSIGFQLELATATDTLTLQSAFIEFIPGVP